MISHLRDISSDSCVFCLYCRVYIFLVIIVDILILFSNLIPIYIRIITQKLLTVLINFLVMNVWLKSFLLYGRVFHYFYKLEEEFGTCGPIENHSTMFKFVNVWCILITFGYNLKSTIRRSISVVSVSFPIKRVGNNGRYIVLKWLKWWIFFFLDSILWM